MATYSYSPDDLQGNTISRVRFELGDIVPEGQEPSMDDNEIQTALDMHPDNLLMAKIYLAERVLFRLSYEVDMSIDGASWSLGQRYDRWLGLLNHLKKEAAEKNSKLPILAKPGASFATNPYFFKDMQTNPRWRR